MKCFHICVLSNIVIRHNPEFLIQNPVVKRGWPLSPPGLVDCSELTKDSVLKTSVLIMRIKILIMKTVMQFYYFCYYFSAILEKQLRDLLIRDSEVKADDNDVDVKSKTNGIRDLITKENLRAGMLHWFSLLLSF